MISSGLPVSQFFEGAGAETPPALFIASIVLTVLFMPMIDFIAGLSPRALRVAARRQIDRKGRPTGL